MSIQANHMNEEAQASQNDKWLMANEAVGPNTDSAATRDSYWTKCEG